MKKRQLIIGLAIAALAIYFTFRNVSWRDFVASLADVHYLYLIPCVVLITLTYAARTYRWQVLLVPLKDIEVKRLYAPMMIGYMGNLLPARAGELVRAYLIGRQHDVPVSGVIATIVVERIFDTLMVLGLFAWLLAFNADIFDGGAQWGGIPLKDLASRFGIAVMALVVTLFACIYLLLFQQERMMALVRLLISPLPREWHDKIVELVKNFSEGLRIVRDLNALAKIAFYSALVWGLILVSYFPMYWAYDLQDKTLGSVTLLLIMICIFIAVLPTPGFVGSFQAGVVIALHEIMRESEVASVSFGMLAWALNMGFVVVAGIYYILREHLSVRQLVEVEEKS
jgi:uncharacterized protein (TIRG00374 family)